MTLDDMEQSLAERGWVAIDLPDPSPVFRIRDQLLAWLRDHRLAGLRSLDEYHLLIPDDDRHVETLHSLANYYWDAALGQSIVSANLKLFRSLIGRDLHVQRYPYLRAVRPAVAADAVPIHRDIYYGASPYEVSVLVPFTDMESSSAMRVVSGSHVAPDAAYPYIQQPSTDVAIRSPKHSLGFAYAPRTLDPEIAARAEPVPLAAGQALIFGLSLVHGGGANTSRRTRFSTDLRVANSLAPVPWSRGVRDDYYVLLCASAITSSARRYLDANAPSGERS